MPTVTITQLPENPSKADELALWREFQSTLPPCSYLALYLKGSDDLLANAMRDDMSTELISAIRANRMDALREESNAIAAAKTARAERDRVAGELKELQRKCTYLRDELIRIADESSALASHAAAARSVAVRTIVDQAVRTR